MATPWERLFSFADTDRDGRVTGKDAVVFFEKSGLPREVLAKVWDLANSQRAGYLDRTSFQKAMQLISIAQQGMEVTQQNYAYAQENGPIPVPNLQGFTQDGMPENPANIPVMGGAGSSFMGTNTSSFISPPSYNPEQSRWGRKETTKKPVPAKVCTSVIDGLKAIYNTRVKPLEEAFKFGHFFSPLLNDSDFEAKPSVLLLGQYSTGKTTFIKFLLGRDYPGCHIGPEPTTDRFVVVYHGLEERRVPGNTLSVQGDKPYQGLSGFGTGFLSRFEGSQCPARLLEEITIVDTPGVLSGEKQRIERNYNFVEIAQWFAARCDLIFLLFDPAKLDISDEFKQVISAMRGHDDKVRIILNKADQVDQQQLMRVYGALMWSLGKVFKTPEVCRVYVGSFNSEAPISTAKNPHGLSLFEAEQKELLQSLYEIPQRSCDRKINEFVKRVRAAKIHMLLIGHMRKQLPAMFGIEKAQKKMMENLPEQFTQVMREHHLPAGDFPDPQRFGEILSAFNLADFPKLTSAMTKQIENVLNVDIPNLVKLFDNPFP